MEKNLQEFILHKKPLYTNGYMYFKGSKENI